MATRSRVALKKNSDAKEMIFAAVALEKRTSAAEAVKRRLFMARLKPCPSLDGLFPELLGSPKAPALAKLASLKNLIWTGLAELSPGLTSWFGD